MQQAVRDGGLAHSLLAGRRAPALRRGPDPGPKRNVPRGLPLRAGKQQRLSSVRASRRGLAPCWRSKLTGTQKPSDAHTRRMGRNP